MAHTPGPFQNEGESGPWWPQGMRVVTESGDVVALVYVPRHDRTDKDYDRAIAEARANVALFAAAPTMYDELKTVRANLHMMVTESILEYYDFTGIDAAIAKAEPSPAPKEE